MGQEAAEISWTPTGDTVRLEIASRDSGTTLTINDVTKDELEGLLYELDQARQFLG